jgi:hypothetical protein
MAADVEHRAEEAGDSKTLAVLARGGLVAYGLVHLLIGWLALQIAWRGSGDKQGADSSGAMQTLAGQPLGKVLLWLIAVSLVALALWQTSVAIWSYRHLKTSTRLVRKFISWARAAIYLGLSLKAASVALGSGSSSSRSQQETTSGILELPAGREIAVGIGLVVVGVGLALAVTGIRETFKSDLDTESMSPAIRKSVNMLAKVGYLAKGAAFGVAGGLLVYAAVAFDSRKSQGMDGALQEIAMQPFGHFLLTGVAIGLIAFGVYAVCESRYRKM